VRIDPELAESVARAAVAEPYRQIKALTTRELEGWLRSRGVELPWDAIHQLWSVGALHPVAVLPAAAERLSDPERFVPITLPRHGSAYADVGKALGESDPLAPTGRTDGVLWNAVLWHPLQAWVFARLARLLRVPISPVMVLRGARAYARLAEEVIEHNVRAVRALADGGEHHEFVRVLCVLLHAEPLVHPVVHGKITHGLGDGESFEGYFEWRRAHDPGDLLNRSGLTVDRLCEWHRTLALEAARRDPVESFRVLLRHADRDKQARMTGDALLANSLYDAAETLRRYLEAYHGCELPEEDDVPHGPRGAEVKEQLYGARRTADYDRSVLRRVARRYGVDPQARTTWFVEGDTEEAFAKRRAGHYEIDLAQRGVEVMNLHGLGGLAGGKLRDLLERFRREEVFPFIMVDEDARADHIRQLRVFTADGLVPAGYRIWKPDFEQANFSLAELAEVATGVAQAGGVPCTITASAIQQEMQTRGKPAGEAITSLWRRAAFYGGKNDTWGGALADWAAEHAAPTSHATAEGQRPVEELLLRLSNSDHFDYRATADECHVDVEGNVVGRSG
jgi:hypothetical protein